MEFEGRIVRVLPMRSGTSQSGNEWICLPFVFAYYESQEQRWEDRVVLETWDTGLMAQIGKFCEKGGDGKVIVENGSVKLNVLDIKCRCGFSHNVKDIQKRDGSGTMTMNEIRCYKLEIAATQSPQAARPAATQAPQPYSKQAPAQQQEQYDDLPF